jgi:PIN domain nuclease of toxin-antitoxin system
VLAEKGRIELDTPIASKWIRNVLRVIPVKEAPLNHEIAISSRKITLSHQDPADRFLAATAKVYDFVLVTSDERLLVSDQIQCLKC